MPPYQDMQPTSPPSLIVPRSDAKTKLEVQIQKGRELFNRDIDSNRIPDKDLGDETKWRNTNITLLQSMFSNTSLADAYTHATTISKIDRFTFAINIEYQFKRRIQKNIIELESILESLDFISEFMPPAPNQVKSAIEVLPGKKVFIVHGHDEGTREAVARLIHQLNLSPVILAEQPNQGQTIIEKFEQSSNDVQYAVVLLTADDIGTSKDKPNELKPRARQNVIFELGFFAAKLGRKNVCALHQGGIEIPSDYHGVTYVSLDSKDWKWQLAREIKQVIPVDLNLLS